MMDGIVGATRLGNTKLIAYGIQNEKSDMRAHVSVIAKSVYIFPTECGKKAIEKGSYKIKPTWTNNIKTAEGYCIPPDKIENCQRILIPKDIFDRVSIKIEESTTIKGNKAVAVVIEMLKRGLIPLTLQINEVTDADLQIQGMDILVKTRGRIQVKCDYRAGYPGTGNLYLQVAECNPNHMK